MPNFNGIEYRKLLTDVIIINKCPYCNKKFLNKNSYRNHILGGYCINCDIKTGKSIDIEIPLDWLGGNNDT